MQEGRSFLWVYELFRLNLFCNKNGTNKLVAEPIENGCVKLENIEIYLSDGQIESIYLLSSGTMRQPI